MEEIVRCKRCRFTLISNDEKECVTNSHGTLNFKSDEECILDKSILYIQEERMPTWLESLVQSVSVFILYNIYIQLKVCFLTLGKLDQRKADLSFNNMRSKTWIIWLLQRTEVCVPAVCPPTNSFSCKQSGRTENRFKQFIANLKKLINFLFLLIPVKIKPIILFKEIFTHAHISWQLIIWIWFIYDCIQGCSEIDSPSILLLWIPFDYMC